MEDRHSFSSTPIVTSLVLAVMMVVLTIPAVAQNVFWAGGQKLAITPDNETTGTLALQTADREKTYQLEGMSRTMRLKLLRLSGEREWDMTIREKTDKRHFFEGENARLTVKAISPETVIVEYQVMNEVDGMAYLTVESDTDTTTATLNADDGDLGFEDGDQPLYIQTVGGKAMRKKTRHGYRVIIPMDEQRVVRIAISTKKLEEKEIESANISAMLIRKPEGDDQYQLRDTDLELRIVELVT